MAPSFQLICAIVAIFATAFQNVVTDDDERCLVENIKVQENFNLDKFLGKWYEIKWIPEHWIPPGTYHNDIVKYFEKYNATVGTVAWVGRESNEIATCTDGTAEYMTTDTPGKLVYLRRNPDNTVARTDYWILLTDYDHYALVWGCQEIQNGRCAEGKDHSWVFSRHSSLSNRYMTLIDQKITEVCLSPDSFILTKQLKECNSGSIQTQFGMTALLPFLLLAFLWNKP